MKQFKIALLFFCLCICISLHGQESRGAILQARITVISTDPHELKTGKVYPGSKVNLQVEIKNIGNKKSAPGKIFTRFVLMEPMEDLLESRIFQTETQNLPVIYPGHVAVIKFNQEHQWPSLNDFIKQNWNMRHYQVVVKINGEKTEKAIGYLPIFFSTYYYEGLGRTAPQLVSSVED